jgi:hypothetical protein
MDRSFFLGADASSRGGDHASSAGSTQNHEHLGSRKPELV